MNPSHPLRRAYAGARHLARRKLRQINRLSRKSVQMGLLLGGAALVALVSLGFAWLADKALEWNRAWVGQRLAGAADPAAGAGRAALAHLALRAQSPRLCGRAPSGAPLRQINRLSRKSVQMGLLLGGAALVALVSLGFAWLADKGAGMEPRLGRDGSGAADPAAGAAAALRWLTLRARRQRHPRIIGALSLPPGPGRPAWSRWFRHCGRCRWPLGWRLHRPRRPVGAGGRGRDAGLGRFLEAPWPTARFPRQ